MDYKDDDDKDIGENSELGSTRDALEQKLLSEEDLN
nr:FLAG epitope peptide [Cloning vector pDXA-FLAG]AAG00933.1 FLAG epitope peptide [Cloning vector pTX-FLAG]